MPSLSVRYHELTKYVAASISNGPGLDWSRQPAQFKEIVSSHRIPLRGYLPFTPDGTRAPEPEGFGLGALSRLLFFTNGVTGLIHYPQGTRQVLRAAPSAGALYPTEVYVAVGDVPGLAPGLYNFQVASHELVRLWEGDQLPVVRAACGDAACFDDAPACVIFTGLFWRSAWRYRERGYRRVLLDTGHAIANLVAYAPEEECRAHTVLGFKDAALNGLFFFDDAVEATLACCPLVPGPGHAEVAPPWRSPVVEAPPDLHSAKLDDKARMPDSASVALHRATECGAAEPVPPAEPHDLPADAETLPAEMPFAHSIPHALLHRRSARGYAGGAIGVDALAGALRYAFGSPTATRADGLLRAWVAALQVDGLAPGVYGIAGAGEALTPGVPGNVADRLLHLSLGQEIAYHSAAVLIFAAPAAAALDRYGDRAYRYLHLEAGVIGERFQLAAGAMELGACGIAGFFDDEAAELVGIESDDWVLYLVTIGQT